MRKIRFSFIFQEEFLKELAISVGDNLKIFEI